MGEEGGVICTNFLGLKLNTVFFSLELLPLLLLSAFQTGSFNTG